MGRRGPKPQSPGVKAQKAPVRSRRRPRTATPAADQVIGGAVEPPSWLKKEGRRIWDRIAPTLTVMKLLNAADAQTFGRYCRNFARWLDMQSRLDKTGEIYAIETASGEVRRADPAFLIADRLEKMLLAVEDRFGLNPAERQRIFAARAQSGARDLFSPGADEKRPGDPAAKAAEPATPEDSPVGLLN
jgi:P27 family predicted phage terminase small subunit